MITLTRALIGAALGIPLLVGVYAAYQYGVFSWTKDQLLGREGVIILNSPAVYTRQRLVNDRLSQTAWLDEQLAQTQREASLSFRSIDQVRIRREVSENRAELEVRAGPNPQPSNGERADGSLERGGRSGGTADSFRQGTQVDVEPTTIELFRAMNAYRDEVRSEIMQVQLDDRHDIQGNTIYRLGFDATVLAGTRADYLAAIKITMRYPGTDQEYDDLYADWIKNFQKEVDNSVNSLTQRILTRSNDADTRRDMTQLFVDSICQRYAEYMSIAPEGCYTRERPSAVSILANGFLKSYYDALNNRILERFRFSIRPQENTGDRISDSALGEAFGFARSVCNEIAQKANQKYHKVITSEEQRQRVAEQIAAKEQSVGPFSEKEGRTWRFNCPGSPSQDEDIAALGILYLYLQSTTDPETLPERVKVLNAPDSGERLFKEIVRNRCGSNSGFECWPEPDNKQARCLAGLYYKHRLDLQATRRLEAPLASKTQPAGLMGAQANSEAAHRVSELVAFSLSGLKSNDCSLRVEPGYLGRVEEIEARKQPGQEKEQLLRDAMALFRHALSGSSGVEVFAYNIGPKNLVQRVATASDMRRSMQIMLSGQGNAGAGRLESLIKDSREKEEYAQLIQRYPIVVGFGSGLTKRDRERETAASDSRSPPETVFGWVIAPQVLSGNVKKQVDGQYSLSAIVSVPSWWRSVELSVDTCWVSRSALIWDVAAMEAGQLSLCESDPKKQMTEKVRLPGAIYEVQRKLGFEVEDEPNISDDQLQNVLEVGKPGSVLVRGGRLWRSTAVTLGAQRADEIIVLPNMRGIVAKFNCIDRQALNTPYVRVWTSEGETNLLAVDVHRGDGKTSPLCQDRYQNLPEDRLQRSVDSR